MAVTEEPPVTTPAKGARGIPWLPFVLLALAGVAVAFIVRLDYGPDEPYHVEYVHVLASEHRMPTPAETPMVQHPPPFYLALAPLWRAAGVTQPPLETPPGPAALAAMSPNSVLARRLLRVTSVVLACLTLLLLARLLGVLDVPPAWRTLLLTLVAAWPMLQYVSGVVNNENAAILFSSVACLVLVRRVVEGRCSLRQAAGIGLLIGGGVLVKQTTLFVAPVALWALWTAGPPDRRWARLGLFVAGAAVLGVWWPLHNRLLTGELFPHFSPVPNQAEVTASVMAHPATLLTWVRLILETNFLPDWSWALLPRAISTLAAVGLVVVAGGCFLWGLRDRSDLRARRLRAMGFAAPVILIAFLLQHAVFSDWRVQIGGRYMLNAIPWYLTLLGASLPLLRRPAAAGAAPPVPAVTGGIPGRPSPLLGLAAVLLVLFDMAWWYVVYLYYSNPNFGH